MGEYIIQGGTTELSGKMWLTDKILPILTSGNYIIKAETTLDFTTDARTKENYTSSLTQNLAVAMKPFTLDEKDIYSTFPMNTASGVYGDVLPHIVFNNRSFPWERNLKGSGGDKKPWVALLIFSEDENTVCYNIKPNDYSSNGVYLPKLDSDILSLMKKEENILVADIPSRLFCDVMPEWDELEYLAHARNVSLDDKVTDPLIKDNWFSVVTANRFPLASEKHDGRVLNKAYLVSLEGFEDILTQSPEKRNLKCDTVRVFCLKHWTFFCENKSFDFLDVTKNMDTGVFAHELNCENTVLNKIFNAGYTPVNHIFREGSRSVSWYRSPLNPYKPVHEEIELCQYPDKLLLYDNELQMFEVSYSAAWQLGRLLALENQSYSQALCRWRTANKCKRARRHNNNIIMTKLNMPSVSDSISETPDAMTAFCRSRWETRAKNAQETCGTSDRFEMRHIIKGRGKPEGGKRPRPRTLNERRTRQREFLESFEIDRKHVRKPNGTQ